MFLVRTVQLCTKIELLLRNLGATGIGLRELVDSVPHELDASMRADLVEVLEVRNHLVHEHNYVYPGSETDFLLRAKAVVDRLGRLGTAQNTPNIATLSNTASNSRIETMEPHMHLSSSLVDIYSIKLFPSLPQAEHISTSERRVVFFYSGAARPMPVGKHTTPIWFSRVTDIGFVRMSPVVLDHRCELITQAGVHVNADLSVTVMVDDSDEAIARVAMDALRDGGDEPALALNTLQRVLIELVNKLALDELMRVGVLQAEVDKALNLHLNNPSALRVCTCLIRSLRPMDDDLATYAETLAKYEIELTLKEQQQKIKAIEIKQREDEIARDRDNRKMDGDLASAQRKDDLQFNHTLEMERLDKQFTRDIEIVKASAQAGTATLEQYTNLFSQFLSIIDVKTEERAKVLEHVLGSLRPSIESPRIIVDLSGTQAEDNTK